MNLLLAHADKHYGYILSHGGDRNTALFLGTYMACMKFLACI